VELIDNIIVLVFFISFLQILSVMLYPPLHQDKKPDHLFTIFCPTIEWREKSWKPECVGSFNMDWWILVFYPEPEARDTIS
jgi:hypothetical protein